MATIQPRFTNYDQDWEREGIRFLHAGRCVGRSAAGKIALVMARILMIRRIMGVIPVYTVIVAGWDGSLGALFIASVTMLVIHLIFERDHWIIPPRGRGNSGTA